ncbi:MAG: hypothetical protein ACREPQ_00640 [Rhodanobacter sp.]
MGFHAFPGTADTAPRFFFNSEGEPSWCGKTVRQMTGREIEAMTAFCQDEGERLGHNDRQAGREKNEGLLLLFHPAFAKGVLHQFWRESYIAAFHEGNEPDDARPLPVIRPMG